MRLIDADKLCEVLDSKAAEAFDECEEHTIRGCRSIVQRMPTVDAVEVVRCKDCKHCIVTSDGMVCECAIPTKQMVDYYIYGSTILARVVTDDFCSYGERRKNNA